MLKHSTDLNFCWLVGVSCWSNPPIYIFADLWVCHAEAFHWLKFLLTCGSVLLIQYTKLNLRWLLDVSFWSNPLILFFADLWVCLVETIHWCKFSLTCGCVLLKQSTDFIFRWLVGVSCWSNPQLLLSENMSLNPLSFNFYNAELFCENHGDQRVFSIWNQHKCLSQLFPLHLNTYVMCVRPLEIV